MMTTAFEHVVSINTSVPDSTETLNESVDQNRKQAKSSQEKGRLVVPEVPSTANYTPLAAIPGAIAEVKETFLSGKTRSFSWRVEQLRQLSLMLELEQDRFCDALAKDLNRCSEETLMFELLPLVNECAHAILHLESWAEPRKPDELPFLYATDKVETRYEPRGVVLIIGTWNYPIQLILAPLVAALSAGNSVVLKLSEVSVHTSNLIAELVPKYLDTTAIKCVSGAVPVTTELLNHKFDYICYTGSTNIGKIIHAAATKHLTPTLLELGGKCPVIVDQDMDPEVVARRIYWGKFVNAGQTCIAPDYIVVHKNIKSKLMEAFKKMPQEFFKSSEPVECKEYSHVIHDNHYNRLEATLEKQLAVPGSSIVSGGQRNPETRFFAPTIIDGVDLDASKHPVMKDEIFGPLLPVIEVDSLENAIETIRRGPSPLALYVFSKKTAFIENTFGKIRAGNAMGNDFFVWMALDVSFGGVGDSGMGGYHGRAGFENFSQQRATMIRSPGMESLNMIRYPAALYGRPKLLKALLGVLGRSTPSKAYIAFCWAWRRVFKPFGGATRLITLLFALGLGIVIGRFGTQS